MTHLPPPRSNQTLLRGGHRLNRRGLGRMVVSHARLNDCRDLSAKYNDV